VAKILAKRVKLRLDPEFGFQITKIKRKNTHQKHNYEISYNKF